MIFKIRNIKPLDRHIASMISFLQSSYFVFSSQLWISFQYQWSLSTPFGSHLLSNFCLCWVLSSQIWSLLRNKKILTSWMLTIKLVNLISRVLLFFLRYIGKQTVSKTILFYLETACTFKCVQNNMQVTYLINIIHKIDLAQFKYMFTLKKTYQTFYRQAIKHLFCEFME